MFSKEDQSVIKTCCLTFNKNPTNEANAVFAERPSGHADIKTSVFFSAMAFMRNPLDGRSGDLTDRFLF